MARIRTIKPEFWTDETLTECSLSARLLFIGTWNFADDNGNLEHSWKQLKMKVFPADDVKCLHLLNELITHGFLIEYSVSDKKYLHIKGFEKHQVINRPSPSSIPKFNDSLIVHGALTEDSMSDTGVLIEGREGKGKERTTLSGKPDVAPLNGHVVEIGILSYLNEKAGHSYKPVEANIKLITARLKEGATPEEIRAVVDRKCAQWKGDEKWDQYLRPETLFNATKFASYQGEMDRPVQKRGLVI